MTRTAAPHQEPQNPCDPPQRRRREPSVAAKRDVILPVAGRPRHRPSVLFHDLDRGPCQLCHVQHRPFPELGLCPQRQHRRRLHHNHSTKASLSGLGFLEILDLTGNVPPKRRCHGVSSSWGSNVKTRTCPTLVVKVAVGINKALDLFSSKKAATHPKFNWSHVPAVYQIWISPCNCWHAASDECQCFSIAKSANQRHGSTPSSGCRAASSTPVMSLSSRRVTR